ncbi:MAG: NUDIX domain-containing protein [Ilumatobacteraceae bacterium]
MGTRDGDGWVRCLCGQVHWGLHGAAGLLLVRTDTDPASVLLQLRAAWTHGGGTWALPGGALDSHEDAVTAAAREAWEEAGIDPSVLEFKAIFSDDHGNWRYDTVIAHSAHDAGAHEANAESEDIRWVPLDDVEHFELHPGLRRAWPELIDHVRSTLSTGA